MRSVLEQFHGDEQLILLMYLAGELPVEHRAALERRLRDEPALREQLESLRATQDAVNAALQQFDQITPAPGSEAPAVRQVGRAIRQWQADRLAASSRRIEPRRQLVFPWWSYPLAAAVAITFAFLAWWRTIPAPDQIAMEPDTTQKVGADNAPEFNTLDPELTDEPVRFAWSDPEGENLSELEREVQSLQLLRESMR
jgi:hypothetical protein